MVIMQQVIVFSIQDQLLALDLSLILKVVLAVELTLLPNTPKNVLGVINLHGEVISVIDLRRIFEIPTREISLNDHFIICQMPHQKVALWVDCVIKTTSYKKSELIPAQAMFSQIKMVDYVVNDAGKIIPIYNLKMLLSMTGLNL